MPEVNTGFAGSEMGSSSQLPTNIDNSPPVPEVSKLCIDSVMGSSGHPSTKSDNSPTKLSDIPSQHSPSPLKSTAESIYRITRDFYFCYDINVISYSNLSTKLPQAVTDEICRAFKAKVGMDNVELPDYKVSNNTFLTTSKIEEFADVFVVQLHQYDNGTGLVGRKPSEAGWKKIVTSSIESDDGVRPWKEWLLMGDLQAVHDRMVISTKHSNTDTETANLDFDDSMIKTYLGTKHEEYQMSDVAKLIPGTAQTAIVFAKCTKVSIPDLRAMGCWSTESESSMLQTLAGVWTTDKMREGWKLKSHGENPMIFGGRVYNRQPIQKAMGLALHLGRKGSFQTSLEGSQVQSKDCHKVFFQPILLSDFVAQYFGTTSDLMSEHDTNLLNRLLRGVHIDIIGKLRDKSPMIQSIRAKTAQEISITVPGSSPPSISLADLAEKQYGRQLHHLELPCIDIGSGRRPFHLPMELCKIQPHQPFKGPVPFEFYRAELSASSPHAMPLKNVQPGDDRKLLRKDNPFGHVEIGRFKILFLEVVVVPPDLQYNEVLYNHVPAEDSHRFRSELGKRFDNLLAKAVNEGSRMNLYYEPGRTTLDSFKKVIDSNLSMTLAAGDAIVACIPGGEHNAKIHHLLRTLCDDALGVQCSVVTANEIIKRCRADAHNPKKGLVTYTGAIARNILARNKISANISQVYKDSDDFKAHYGTKTVSNVNGLSIGVHVQPLCDLFPGSTNATQAEPYLLHLVTLCSLSTEVKYGGVSEQDFRTSHHLVSCERSPLSEKLMVCVKKHFGLPEDGSKRKAVLYSPKKVVVYRSGYLADDRIKLTAEIDGFSEMMHVSQKNNFGRVEDIVHMTYVQHPTMALAPESTPLADNELNCVVRADGRSMLMNGEKVTELFSYAKKSPPSADDYVDPFGLNGFLHQLFVRPRSDLTNGGTSYLVTHVQESSETRNTTHNKHIAELMLKKHKELMGVKKVEIQPRLAHKIEAFGNSLANKEVADGVKLKDVNFQFFHSELKKTLLPDMIFLTQKASKRAINLIKPGYRSQDVGGEKIPFELQPVHDDLQGSLYFL